MLQQQIENAIPEDIIFQIVAELPVKSLLRFKSVSKRWCSMIEGPDFVKLLRQRSYHRRGGVAVLIIEPARRGHGFSLLDSESNSDTLPLEDPRQIQGFLHHVSCVEGLVCFGNTIWNPSTRKITYLPPPIISINHITFHGWSTCYVHDRFFLGFDASNCQYKVLSVCYVTSRREDDSHEVGWQEDEKEVVMQVVTLGTNSWRDISDRATEKITRHSRFIGEEFCSIKNMIVLSVRFPIALLVFEVEHEKFRTIAYPDDDVAGYLFKIIEVGDRLALIHKGCTRIWILEDFESGNWRMVNLTWPEPWIVNPAKFPYVQCMSVEPITSIQTGEILFFVDERSGPPLHSMKYFSFLYDMETRSIRRVSQLTGRRVYSMSCQLVETVFPLR